MTSTDPRSEETLFATALAMPEAARAAWLDQACGGDAALRASVEALLRAHLAADGFLPSLPGVARPATPTTPRAEEQPGDWIGRYKLLQKIGEGGCGIVYLAEQEQPIRRRVALKVIKLGMDTKAVVARFEAERQALAMMDHPNIARVLDAGTTDSGRPFFVMELVRGIPVTKYCDEQGLPTEKRLELFGRICHALQHAHQKGIIHRDIKPSNILVTLHDGVPVPKVIDFGIAKATQGRLTDHTYFTAFEQFVGTPAYMSPEQAEMSGLDIDTRSDIYSLGVLLYELLAGRPPFDPKTFLAAGLDEMRRLIREVDPPRPSARLSTLTDADRTTVARQRGTAPAQLSTTLAGDLDWIVMRCIEKDRTRRYATPSELFADIQRHLDHEPVIARPPSTGYLLRKLMRRHKLGFAAGATVALSLIAGLVTSSILFVREHRAGERAVAAEATAKVSAAKSEQVARFMKDMLDGIGPNAARGRNSKEVLQEALNANAKRLDTELQGQPEVAADLRHAIGSLYLDIEQYEEAESLLRTAVATRRALFGNESEKTAASLHLLGQALRGRNKSDEAKVVLQEALAIREKRFGRENPRYADTLLQVAMAANASRRTAETLAMLEEALAIYRKTSGRDHPDVAAATVALGQAAAQLEIDHVKAAGLLEEALAMQRRLLGNDHPKVAATLTALGWSLAHELDRQSDAAAAYREAFELQRKVHGDRPPSSVALLLRLTAQMPARDIPPETIATAREFVASQRKSLPGGSPLLAPSLLAVAAIEDRRDPEAVREALGIFEQSRASAPLDANVVHAMWFFGWAKFVGNAPAEGLIMAEEAWKLAPGVWAVGDINRMQAAHTLAWIYSALGRHDEAAKLFEDALRHAKSPEARKVALVDVAALGACYRATNRVAEAHNLLAAKLAELENSGGELPPQVAHLRCQLGLTLLREGRPEEAEVVLRQAVADYKNPKIPRLQLRLHPPQRAMSGLGQALAAQGKFTEAAPFVTSAFEELQANEGRIAGNRSGMVREAHDAVLALYSAWGKPEKVAEWKAAGRR